MIRLAVEAGAARAWQSDKQVSLKRYLAVLREAGVRAFMVQGKDEEARQLCLRFGMSECPSNPLRLYFLMKDVLRRLADT